MENSIAHLIGPDRAFFIQQRGEKEALHHVTMSLKFATKCQRSATYRACGAPCLAPSA